MTPNELQKAVADIIRDLFADEKLTDSAGNEKTITVYEQELPFRERRSEEDDDKPEPYVIVRLIDMSRQDAESHTIIRFAVICCVCDEDPDRQGYRDAVHLMNRIFLRFVEDGTVGGYTLVYPVSWATQQDDSHPYYFTGVELSFESTDILVKELPFI